MKMRRGIPLLVLILLVGCTTIELSPECERYSETKQISKLAGIRLGMPIEVIEAKEDCKAKYKKADTTFDLYYWRYSSDKKFYSEFNHSLIHTSNCEGSLCDKIYEFHYLGPPRELEVTCKQGKIRMNDKGNIKEKEIDCNSLKHIGKYNQKTWKCDYNKIIAENCQ